MPVLEDHGLRGTFYLVPNGIRWERNLPRWQEVAKNGHEIGNHTLSHICSLGFLDAPGGAPALEGLTLEAIEQDILAAEARLQEAFPAHGPRSFCYPCYQDFVGRGATRQSYVPIVARHFVAARGLGEVPNHPATCDLHYLWSWPAERMDHHKLIGLAEACAAQGRWGIFTFHGVGEGHLPIARHDLELFCAHLARNADRLWVAPVATVAVRIAEWRKGLPLHP